MVFEALSHLDSPWTLYDMVVNSAVASNSPNDRASMGGEEERGVT